MKQKLVFHYTGNKKYRYLQSIGVKKAFKMKKKRVTFYARMRGSRKHKKVSFRAKGKTVSFYAKK